MKDNQNVKLDFTLKEKLLWCLMVELAVSHECYIVTYTFTKSTDKSSNEFKVSMVILESSEVTTLSTFYTPVFKIY